MGLPWSEAVLRVMETRAYTSRKHHSASFIARTLGIESTQVAEVIRALAEARVIELRGGTYRVVGTLVVDTGVEPDLYERSRRHWAHVALERANRARNLVPSFHAHQLARLHDSVERNGAVKQKQEHELEMTLLGYLWRFEA